LIIDQEGSFGKILYTDSGGARIACVGYNDVAMAQGGKLEYIQVSERRRLIAETELEKFLSRRIVAPPKKKVDRPRDYDRPWSGPVENGSLANGVS